MSVSIGSIITSYNIDEPTRGDRRLVESDRIELERIESDRWDSNRKWN